MNLCTDIWNLICEFANYGTTIALSRSSSKFHHMLRNKVNNYFRDIPFSSEEEKGKVLYKDSEKIITFQDGKYHIYKKTMGEMIGGEIVLTANAKRNELYVSSLLFTSDNLSFLSNEHNNIALQIKLLSYRDSSVSKETSTYFTVGFGYLASRHHTEIGINLDPYYRILTDNIYNDMYIQAKRGKKFHILRDRLSKEDTENLLTNININNLSHNIKLISEVKDYRYDFVKVKEIDCDLYRKLHGSPYHPHIISHSFNKSDIIFAANQDNIDLSTTAFIYCGGYITNIYYKSVDFNKRYENYTILLGLTLLLVYQNPEFKSPYLICPACRVDRSMKDISFLRFMMESCNRIGETWEYMSKVIQEHISQI